MIFYFASAFEDLSASTDNDDFMDTIRSMVYAFLILGVVILVSMTTQNYLAESAAETMTHNLKTDWFRALLRQDMAYFDIRDVSGEATIISTNGNRYHRGVGRKLAESIQYFVTFAGSIIYAFYSSWQVSLAVLGITPFLSISVYFLLRMNQSQTARSNATYARAGSIVHTAITSLRTILSLNAVERIIDEYKQATKEAHDGAVSQVWLVGLAYGSQFSSFMLSYVVVTLFGTWLLYDNVLNTGCDPSGTVDGNERCDPAGVDVFGALMGVSFGAAVLPQISVSIEKFMGKCSIEIAGKMTRRDNGCLKFNLFILFTGAREACYPALQVINRRRETTDAFKESVQDDEALTGYHRGDSKLPPYIIDSSSPEGKKPSSVSGEISFHDVRFAYPTRKEVSVFDGLNLVIPAGKTVRMTCIGSIWLSGRGKVKQVILSHTLDIILFSNSGGAGWKVGLWQEQCS